ncbi:MAG TPA: YcnI family protein [Gaiellaceae bacterium]|nr:YcnI family protein [Gaiellaceae bacterium]
MRFRTLLVAAALAAAVLAPSAAAHVTLNPDAVPADSFSRFSIRVPTERGVPTTKVSVRIPEGLIFVSFQPKPGWKRTVQMVKLAKPVTVEGETVTERVGTVTWSGGQIGPGEFDEFGMSAHVPNSPGRELIFPAVQTYANGEVVRWIGDPSADEPAPRVKLEAAEPEPASATATTTNTASDEGDEEDSDDKATLALGFGIAGLVAGLAGLGVALYRRRAA